MIDIPPDLAFWGTIAIITNAIGSVLAYRNRHYGWSAFMAIAGIIAGAFIVTASIDG